MLDPDEVAHYEEWKGIKLAGSTDLSITAYNTEMEALALAWDNGAVKAIDEAVGPADAQKRSSLRDLLKAQNPHRKPGMKGART